jgi:hypothetical protein
MDINKIIDIIRFIKEENGGMMTTGSTTGAPGFSAAADPQGPTAGYDKVMGKMMRRKKIIGLGKGSRNRWKKPQ